MNPQPLSMVVVPCLAWKHQILTFASVLDYGSSLVAQTVKNLQCRSPRFDPWVGKIIWRKEWQPIPVFLPGEFHGQRSLMGHSPWGRKELDTTE